jgi:ribonucleotide reductase beta subunit family protein with ferritin-like domain
MKEVDFKTYKLLFENKSISKSAIPKSVLQSDIFKNLLRAEILESLKFGRGFKIEVTKENQEILKNIETQKQQKLTIIQFS